MIENKTYIWTTADAAAATRKTLFRYSEPCGMAPGALDVARLAISMEFQF